MDTSKNRQITLPDDDCFVSTTGIDSSVHLARRTDEIGSLFLGIFLFPSGELQTARAQFPATENAGR